MVTWRDARWTRVLFIEAEHPAAFELEHAMSSFDCRVPITWHSSKDALTVAMFFS
jgi:hypothetical protein